MEADPASADLTGGVVTASAWPEALLPATLRTTTGLSSIPESEPWAYGDEQASVSWLRRRRRELGRNEEDGATSVTPGEGGGVSVRSISSWTVVAEAAFAEAALDFPAPMVFFEGAAEARAALAAAARLDDRASASMIALLRSASLTRFFLRLIAISLFLASATFKTFSAFSRAEAPSAASLVATSSSPPTNLASAELSRV